MGRRVCGLGGLSFPRLSPAWKRSVFPPLSPSLRAAGPRSGNKNRIVSQDGETQSGPACLHMSAHVTVCVRLSPVPVIYPKYLLRCQCLPVCCTPSKRTLPLAPTPHNLSSHAPNPHMYGLCFWRRCHANSPLSLGERGSGLSPLCLLLETVDNCRLRSSYFPNQPFPLS